MSFGSFFKSLGQKIVSGVSYVGKKLGDAVSVGVKGLKYVTDKADQYTFGLTSFIPYYGLVKAGIDIADDVVKLDAAEASILIPAPASIVIAPVESISKTPASISTTELALAVPSI